MFEQQKATVSRAAFPATDWRLIGAAGTEQSAGAAHGRFCELYWFPVYAFIRRTWPAKPLDEVLEATQEFFTLRLEKRDLIEAKQYDGRFRHWIMGAVSNLLRNQRKQDHAQKRDRRKLVSIDGVTAEARLRLEPKTKLDPLRLLERDLAVGVIERALTRLGNEYGARGQAVFFTRAAHLLVPGEGEAGYAELERQWGLPANTLKVRVHTMRQRLAQLVGRELGVANGDTEAASGQVVWLFQALDLFDPDRETGLNLNPNADIGPEMDREGGSSWKSRPAATEAPA